MKITVFCPGHLTGFFFPCEHDEPLRSGSRGAGLCVDRGAISQVEVRKGSGTIAITINGQTATAPVSRTTIELLLGGRPLDVTVDTTLQLPAGAGFGMSAAGALSAALAFTKAAARADSEAFAAAHRSELLHRAGLGDVPALTAGGLTFRRKEGLPPYGRIDRIAEQLELVAGVVGHGIPTANILTDAVVRKKIMMAGEEAYAALDQDPSVRTFFDASRGFTERSGLASPRVLDALREIDAYGQGSMIMLGNSVFSTGDLNAIEAVLRRYGPTYRLSLDPYGPRVTGIEY